MYQVFTGNNNKGWEFAEEFNKEKNALKLAKEKEQENLAVRIYQNDREIIYESSK